MQPIEVSHAFIHKNDKDINKLIVIDTKGRVVSCAFKEDAKWELMGTLPTESQVDAMVKESQEDDSREPTQST